MVRVVIDLYKLPETKRVILNTFIENLNSEEVSYFINGIVCLGFITIKQSNFKSIANLNIRTKGSSKKYRLNITFPALLKAINSIGQDYAIDSSKKQGNSLSAKRNFIYALLYSGITCYAEYIDQLKKIKPHSKEFEQIEKNLFLSGLSSFIDDQIRFEFKATHKNYLNKETKPIEESRSESPLKGSDVLINTDIAKQVVTSNDTMIQTNNSQNISQENTSEKFSNDNQMNNDSSGIHGKPWLNSVQIDVG